jgi:Flp pilus assembly protein TadG
MSLIARLWQRVRRDDGQVSLFVAAAAFGILAAIGLAVDGGGRMRTLQHADNIAAEAARAAGQAIDLNRAAATGEKVLDPSAAARAGQQYLAAAGVTGTITISADRQQVTVTVHDHYNTVFLGILGYGRLAVEGHGAAQLLTG